MRRFAFVAAVAALASVPAHAQETPTERDAARAVVQKQMDLERSLGIDALVARLTGPNAARDAVAARAKQLMDTELLALGDDITKHPEIGFQETRSVQLLVDYLKKHDFDVTMGVGELKTAFVARYTKSTPGPKLGVILEYVASWLRAQENHVLAVPRETIEQLPERLQELLGYNIFPPFVGYVDGRHPRRYIREPVRR